MLYIFGKYVVLLLCAIFFLHIIQHHRKEVLGMLTGSSIFTGQRNNRVLRSGTEEGRSYTNPKVGRARARTDRGWEQQVGEWSWEQFWGDWKAWPHQQHTIHGLSGTPAWGICHQHPQYGCCHPQWRWVWQGTPAAAPSHWYNVPLK